MQSQRVVLCRWSLGMVVLVGLLATGCAMREPQAIVDLQSAHTAIVAAEKAGAAERFPEDFAALQQRHLEARGIFYACRDAQASELAQALTADAKALAGKRVEAPKPPARAAAPPPPNQPPRAALLALAPGMVETLQRLDARQSSDPDQDPLTYAWGFGDGKTAKFTWPIATHRYANPGMYTVRLTVEDGRGGADTTTTAVPISRHMVLYHGRDRHRIAQGIVNVTASADLDIVVRDMQNRRDLRARIISHTDDRATAAYNIGLSRRRAEAARNYLTSRGISPTRITTEWQGEHQPLASNATAEGRQLNRRTEVLVHPAALR